MTPDQLPLVLISGMNLSERLWSRCRLPADTLHVVPEAASVEEETGRLLDTLPDKFLLGGLSLGGILAMHLASAAPERVAGLLLMATNPRRPTQEQISGWENAASGVRSGTTPRAYQESILPLLLSRRARDRSGNQDAALGNALDSALDSASDIPREVLLRQLSLQMTRVDERPGLTRCGVPVLILAGGDDALCPVANHEEIRDLVPEAELTVLPGVGHLIPVEDPDAVADAVARLRRRVTRVTGPAPPADRPAGPHTTRPETPEGTGRHQKKSERTPKGPTPHDAP